MAYKKFCTVLNFFKDTIKSNFGLYFLCLLELVLLFVLIFWRNEIFVTINDNLDSNVPLFRMFRYYNLWLDRTSPVPFLGGLDREVLTCTYTFSNLIYWFFDTDIAYWLNYIVAIALSSLGFYSLGRLLQRSGYAFIDSNVCCFVGILYILMGMWPPAIVSFSLIPWWFFLLLQIYKTNKFYYAIFLVVILYNISLPLIGIFLLFYTVVYFLFILIKQKRINWVLFNTLALIMVMTFLFNYRVIVHMLFHSENTIKVLNNVDGYVYNDSVLICLKKMISIFLLTNRDLYHTGLHTLSHMVLPIVLFFGVFFNIRKNEFFTKVTFLYNTLILLFLWNVLLMAFDKSYLFRKWISFLSGFSFARFMWLSPFVIMMAFLLVLCYLHSKRFYKLLALIWFMVLYCFITDPGYLSKNVSYNVLSTNYIALFRNYQSKLFARWQDYFAERLFQNIKRDIRYDGEWTVAYGFEPSILQYNGLKTIDGYYSNYPVKYKLKWEKMIMPVLLLNSSVLKYWRISNGHRAYIYSTDWVMPDYNLQDAYIQRSNMLIDRDVFEEFGVKYIFSSVEIANAEKLSFSYLGSWKDENNPYTYPIYVYKNDDYE